MSSESTDFDDLMEDVARCERRIAELNEDLAAERRILRAVHDSLRQRAPYPYCHHPAKCIPGGRCKSEIACND
jgi:hypothetical protein